MNDFLKSLRANKDRRFDRNSRRPYNTGNNYGQRGNEKNVNGNMKKGHHKSVDMEKLTSLVEGALPNIQALLERIAAAGERWSLAEERKTDAIEQLTEALAGAIQTGTVGIPVAVQSAPALVGHETPVERPVNNMPREAVLEVIYSMRDGGATYGEIAAHLENDNIPTFSGKGKWHAQTVHRVCQVRE